jgi:ribosomal protein S18 acetylase RimI-like enzyme
MQPVRATLEDVQSLIVFFHQAWKESGPSALGLSGATKQTINEIASERFLKERLTNPDVNIYVVKHGESVLGFAATRVIDRDTTELSGIIVLESAAGKGFGTQLVEEAVSSARQAGFHKMIVRTEVVNERAIGFYRRMEFAEVGKTRENVEGTVVDIMVLERKL